MTSSTGAHVQLFTSTPSSTVRWRLLSGNNRDIGRSVYEFADEETCRLAVKELQHVLDEVESTVRRTVSNQWTWGLSRATVPVAASGRSFDRLIRCEQGLASFLLLMPDAEIGSTLMVSNARRWRSSPNPATRATDSTRSSSAR